MIERHELTALAKSMGLVVRSVVGPLHAEIKELRAECARLSAIVPQAGPAGRDADPEVIRGMVREAVAELPPPPAGPAGKDADMEFIFQTVTERIEKAVAALPPAPAGPPGPAGRDIQPEELSVLIHEYTERAGENIMRELSSRMSRGIAAEMATVVASIPAPVPGPAGKDGVSVDVDELKRGLLGAVKDDIQHMRSENEAWRQEAIEVIISRSVRGPEGPAGRDAEPVSVEPVRQELLSIVTAELQRLSVAFDQWSRKAQAEVVAAAVPGPQGPAGEPGPAGRDAEPPHPDTLRLAVVEAVRAAISEIPRPADGERGEPGRDAAELEILSALQEGKVYPRGTFAYHLGGMVRAFRKTDPFSEADALAKQGWEVAVDGLHDWTCEQSADQRSFTISARTTSGRVHTSTFSLPALIYREVYEQGKVYVRGDVVTYGGHAWHCGVDTTSQKPGIGTHWRMMVKEGRAGKQGPEGPAGKDGKDGRDGRDLTQISYDGGKH